MTTIELIELRTILDSRGNLTVRPTHTQDVLQVSSQGHRPEAKVRPQRP
jgi:hypothetical protein